MTEASYASFVRARRYKRLIQRLEAAAEALEVVTRNAPLHRIDGADVRLLNDVRDRVAALRASAWWREPEYPPARGRAARRP